MSEQCLNKSFINKGNIDRTLVAYSGELFNLPEKIIQFGEGNFIRAFFDYFIHKLNCKGLFNGRIVVVKPRKGSLKHLRAQDCLFTLITAGVSNNELIYEKEIIASISRAMDTYDSWEQVLELSKNEQIEIIVSNTTETGIKFDPYGKLKDKPPDSYPAKLTQILYRRFSHKMQNKGFIIIPLELIENNGNTLKEVVLKYADLWELKEDFKEWIVKANLFINTLVDRIVPGYPIGLTPKIFDDLGYTDNFLTLAEVYHLFAIEETNIVKKVLPFDKAGLNVVYADNITMYRDLKVKILNGSHTAIVTLAVLHGIVYVKDLFNNDKLNKCINHIIFNEIIPTLDYEREVTENFAKQVIERFKNPYLEHKWTDILLNNITKFNIRLMPTVNKYYKLYGKAPQILSFSYSLLINLFKNCKWEGNSINCIYENVNVAIHDENTILSFLQNLWIDFNKDFITLDELLDKIISNKKVCNIEDIFAADFANILEKHLYNLEKQTFPTYVNTILKNVNII